MELISTAHIPSKKQQSKEHQKEKKNQRKNKNHQKCISYCLVVLGTFSCSLWRSSSHCHRCRGFSSPSLSFTTSYTPLLCSNQTQQEAMAGQAPQLSPCHALPLPACPWDGDLWDSTSVRHLLPTLAPSCLLGGPAPLLSCRKQPLKGDLPDLM